MITATKKTTLRIKDKTNRKSGKEFSVLTRNVVLPNGEVIIISIACDKNGKVKTYKSSKNNNEPFIYCDLRMATNDFNNQPRWRERNNPSGYRKRR